MMGQKYINMIDWIEFLVDTANSLEDNNHIRKIVSSFEHVLLNDYTIEYDSFKTAISRINDTINAKYTELIISYSERHKFDYADA